MNDRDLVFEVSREGQKIRIGFYERSEAGEGTLRPYEECHAAWDQIEAACKEIVALLNRANSRARVTQDILQGLKKSGQLLFDLLITAKAREKINSTTAKNLILYLDDQLVQIPWELLYNGREFLCRKFAVGRIVSTRQPITALSGRNLRMPFKVLVLADPRGDLEAAYREGTEIRDFLDGKAGMFQVDFKSHPTDVQFVKKNIREYDIVHYAGHADYRPQNPCESGWLLTEGKLRASEVCPMGGLQPMPLLVFSNACQSGQTDEWHIQEGCEQQIFGLANAYLLAGVQHYIGTFWEILDEPSSYFAKRFYSFLAEGESVGEAVRRARQALVDAYGEETIVWASYMLYGDPTFVLASQEQAVRVAEPTRQTPRVEWNQVVRREASTQLQKTKPERIPHYFYPVVGLLVLASFLVGYYQLGPSSIRAAIEKVGVASPVLAPLTLSMNVIGQRRERDGSYIEVLVSEGSILRSRDHFQLHLETNNAAYVYILLYDSQGKASQIFPDPKIPQPGFVEGGRKIAVPAPDLWFWLDDHPGTETIYVLASEKPLSDIQGLLTKMESVDEGTQKQLSQEIQQRIILVQRGVGGVTKGKATSYKLSDGKQIQKVTDVVSGAGAVVRAITIQHQ